MLAPRFQLRLACSMAQQDWISFLQSTVNTPPNSVVSQQPARVASPPPTSAISSGSISASGSPGSPSTNASLQMNNVLSADSSSEKALHEESAKQELSWTDVLAETSVKTQESWMEFLRAPLPSLPPRCPKPESESVRKRRGVSRIKMLIASAIKVDEKKLDPAFKSPEQTLRSYFGLHDTKKKEQGDGQSWEDSDSDSDSASGSDEGSLENNFSLSRLVQLRVYPLFLFSPLLYVI